MRIEACEPVIDGECVLRVQGHIFTGQSSRRVHVTVGRDGTIRIWDLTMQIWTTCHDISEGGQKKIRDYAGIAVANRVE